MYQQTLYKIVEPIKPHVVKRLNKSKKWKYGYNKEYDIIVISRTGQIGEIYEIQNLGGKAFTKRKECITLKLTNGKTHEYLKGKP